MDLIGNRSTSSSPKLTPTHARTPTVPGNCKTLPRFLPIGRHRAFTLKHTQTNKTRKFIPIIQASLIENWRQVGSASLY